MVVLYMRFICIYIIQILKWKYLIVGIQMINPFDMTLEIKNE